MTATNSHLPTLDTFQTVPSLQFTDTNVVDVRIYGGIVITILSDNDFSIVVEWSVDGVVFIPDLDRVISYTGGSGEGFYERDVIGEYVRLVITNIGGTDEEIFIQGFAKIRATGNFDNGVNLDIPTPTPPPDVWWERDPSDPSQITSLLPPDINGPPPRGGVCYCDLQRINRVDPSVDYQGTGTFLHDALTLDWANKITANFPRGAGFNRTFSASNAGNVRLRGPYQTLNVVTGCNGDVLIENTDSSPQDRPNGKTHYLCCIGGTNPSIPNSVYIANMSQSIVSCIHNNARVEALLEFQDGAPGQDDLIKVVGFNRIHNVSAGTIISDAIFNPNGCQLREVSTDRVYNSFLLANSLQFSHFLATRVIIPGSLPPADVSGICVLTDHTKPDDTTTTNFLNIGPVAPGIGVDNTFYSRYSGGYVFYTDEDSTVSLRIRPGTDFLVPICDNRVKTNIVEYTDTAGVLSRLVNCPVNTYNHKKLWEKDPVKEGEFFRISPISQDFNQVFHPEEGDDEMINTHRKNECTDDYRAKRQKAWEKKFEKTGEKLPGVPCTPEQQAQIDSSVDEELTTPEVQNMIETASYLPLNTQEYIASLHLAIKELSKQVDLLKVRCTTLENVVL